MGTSDHRRGVGTTGSMFKTSRECPSETVWWVVRRRERSPSCQVLGSHHCFRRLFSWISCCEEAVGLESL
jgi:hypothetical protein